MPMRTPTHTTKTPNQLRRLTSAQHHFSKGETKPKPSIENVDDLKKELKKAGYSQKAIQEILKWVPYSKK